MENYASCEGQKVLYALTKQLARVLSSQQDGERLLYQLLLTDGRIKDTDDRHVEECFEKAPVTENEDFNSSHGPIVIYHAGFQKAKILSTTDEGIKLLLKDNTTTLIQLSEKYSLIYRNVYYNYEREVAKIVQVYRDVTPNYFDIMLSDGRIKQTEEFKIIRDAPSLPTTVNIEFFNCPGELITYCRGYVSAYIRSVQLDVRVEPIFHISLENGEEIQTVGSRLSFPHTTALSDSPFYESYKSSEFMDQTPAPNINYQNSTHHNKLADEISALRSSLLLATKEFKAKVDSIHVEAHRNRQQSLILPDVTNIQDIIQQQEELQRSLNMLKAGIKEFLDEYTDHSDISDAIRRGILEG